MEAELLTASTFDDALAARAAQRIDSLLERVTGATPAERVLLAGGAFHRVAAGTGTGEEIAALAEAATAGGLIVREQGAGALYPSIALACLLFTDRLDSAEAVLAAMAEDARRTGSPTHMPGTRRCARATSTCAGIPPRPKSMPAARSRCSRRALTLATEMALAFLVFALVEQGKLDDAEAELAGHGAEAGPLSPTTSGMTLTARPLRAPAWTAAGSSRHAKTPRRSSVASASAGDRFPGAATAGVPSSRFAPPGVKSSPSSSRARTSPPHSDSASPAPIGIALTVLGVVQGGPEGIATPSRSGRAPRGVFAPA